MADQADVELALVVAASAALYPQGTEETSVPGPDCRIYRGWPNSTALDADLTAGKINVTVFPAGGNCRTTTRFAKQWTGDAPRPTLTVAVSGNSVTFGGTAEVGQIAGILVDGASYVYRTQSGDTPQLVAANLASMARTRAIVRLSDATLTVPDARNLLARVVSDASVQQEIRRQEQSFRVTCWCPTPASRDITAATIDRCLSSQPFLTFADGTNGRMSYVDTTVFDQSQNARLYRRDLTYNVEYATVATSTNPCMLFGNLVLNTTTITA